MLLSHRRLPRRDKRRTKNHVKGEGEGEGRGGGKASKHCYMRCDAVVTNNTNEGWDWPMWTGWDGSGEQAGLVDSSTSNSFNTA